MRRLGEALQLAGLIALSIFSVFFTFCWFTVFPTLGLLWSLGVLK